MFAPNLSTQQLADSVHHERQAHAARLHRIIRDREAGDVAVDHTAHRRMTARRLVASVTAIALTLVIAAAAAADGPNATPAGPSKMAPANGGGLVLIR